MNYYQQKNIKSLLERKLYFFVGILLTVVITIGSLISVENVIELPPVNFADKILHLSAYFLLTFSWLGAFFNKNLFFRNSILTAIIVFVYGIVIEVLQGTITTYRQTDIFDLGANLEGIVIAWVFFYLFFLNKYRMK